MKISINVFNVLQEITIGSLDVDIYITNEHNYLKISHGPLLLSMANLPCREMNRFTLNGEVYLKETPEMRQHLEELISHGIIVVSRGSYDLHPTLRRSIMMLGQWKNRAPTQAMRLHGIESLLTPPNT